jgi:membrane protease YdiL (CAAX protease family)
MLGHVLAHAPQVSFLALRKCAMEAALLSTVLQVGVVLVIALLAYAFAGRNRGRFNEFTGLKGTTQIACLAGLALAVAALVAAQYVPGFFEAARSPNSVVGKLTAGGVNPEVTAILVLTALVKTSFAEELFFRGILGKRLIGWLGFHVGNFIQALAFGAVHLLLFLSPEVQASPLRPEYVVAFTRASGWLNGLINEKLGAGSILPGWIAHGLTNLVSYLGVAYGLL